MNKNALDVAIEVLNIRFKDANKIVMRVNYINLGYVGQPKVIMILNNFVIDMKDYKDWVRLSPDQVYSVRTKAGLPE